MTDLSVDSGGGGEVVSRLSEVEDDEGGADEGGHKKLVKSVSACSGDVVATRDCKSQTSDYSSDSNGEESEKNRDMTIDMSPDPPNKNVKIDIPEESIQNVFPSEPIKTGLSAVFLLLGWIATTASLALTHERVPDTAPLPDILLDNVPYQNWALDVSEILIMISTISGVLVVMCHNHRLIILRRIWLLLGILYFYRAITMYITVLPKADTTYTCSPKMDNTTIKDYAHRVLTIISGGGLSINGKHIYCGDYIFSGHTLVLTMGYLVIKQYSPRRFFLLHWTSFLVSVAGVVLLILARGHYSIDVLVAYWITSRLWLFYHTMANNTVLKTAGEHNLMDAVWWWRIFLYFEGNVGGQLPRQYGWPLPIRFLIRMVTRFSCQWCRRAEGRSQVA